MGSAGNDKCVEAVISGHRVNSSVSQPPHRTGGQGFAWSTKKGIVAGRGPLCGVKLYEVLVIDPAWTFAADDPNDLGTASLWPHSLNDGRRRTLSHQSGLLQPAALQEKQAPNDAWRCDQVVRNLGRTAESRLRNLRFRRVRAIERVTLRQR